MSYTEKKYDENNIFAKILRGDIPCDKVYEDEYVLAFRDVNPKAETHVLVIPKSKYISFDDFSQKVDQKVDQKFKDSGVESMEIAIFFNRVGMIAKKLGLAEGGYRIIMNTGENGGQEVPHFHVHIIGGEKLGGMIGSK